MFILEILCSVYLVTAIVFFLFGLVVSFIDPHTSNKFLFGLKFGIAWPYVLFMMIKNKRKYG